jgi:assimilatory nitrate reductase catalytic subunit
MICQVARRLGFEQGFDFSSPAQIFDEHARLSAHANDGSRAFNLEGLVGLDAGGYAELEPIQWPVHRCVFADHVSVRGTARLIADGRFYHPDGRARLIPTRPRAPRYLLDEEYPLVLNTGRVRDQWHTMTRSGRSASLSSHRPEPFVDMHPADALRFGLRRGTLVRVATRWGRLVARLSTSGEVTRGTIFLPIHWSDSNASDARVGALVNPVVDPLSGEPEFKHTPVRVEPFVVSWYGFALTRKPLAAETLSWWACAQSVQCLHYEIAGRRCPKDWSGWAHRLLCADARADWIEYEDAATLTYRAAQLVDERIEACIFISERPALPSYGWLSGLFQKPRLSETERGCVLSAGPPGEGSGAGATVCACLSISRSTIETAIAQGCHDVRAIGAKLRAGTQCGSCVPEVKRMIRAATGVP